MDNTYYIVITVIFGLFVLFVVWWLYKHLRTNRFPKDISQLSEEDQAVLHKFCLERKHQKEPVEKEKKKKEK